LIASPVAGLCPIPGCTISNLQNAKACSSDSLPFLKVLRDHTDEIVKQGFTGPF
jgi:hypothetical protein